MTPRVRNRCADQRRAATRAPLCATLCLIATCGLSGAGCSEPAEPAPERIVLVVADTLRRDFLSPYGSKVATPNVARLAARGQVFTNMIASFHQTTMSMAALFTGRTPSIEAGERGHPLPWTSTSWCGMARLATSDGDSCIPDALVTLTEDLQGAGYATLGVVSNRLIFRPYGYDQGFDKWIEVGEPERAEDRASRVAESKLRTAKRVNQRVIQALSLRKTDRFFLYVHYIDPHDYGIRPDLRSYADGVRYFDTALGQLLDHLEAEGLLAGATVIFTADHGEYLGEKHAVPAMKKHFGNPSIDSLLKIPLIIAPPTNRDPTAFVRSQDLRSLIREIAALDSLTPIDIEPDEVFLTEQFYQTYRRGRWKSMMARDREDTVLFDLKNDPGETRNVADENPGVVREHRRRAAELTAALGTRQGEDAELTAEDEDRLRALGYIE